jgi:hypothetical protein
MSNSLVNVKKNEKESNHIKIVTENKIAYASDNVEVERNEVIWRIKQLIFDENVKLFYIVCAYLIFSSLFFSKKKKLVCINILRYMNICFIYK